MCNVKNLDYLRFNKCVDVVSDDDLIKRLKHVGCMINGIFVHVVILVVIIL